MGIYNVADRTYYNSYHIYWRTGVYCQKGVSCQFALRKRLCPQQNIIDTYKDKPIELAIALNEVKDNQTIQELADTLRRSPEVLPEVVAVAVQAEKKAIVSIDPIPETIAQLIDSKIPVTASEVQLLQEHLTDQTTDPATFQTYVAQIKEDPAVAKTIEKIGGKEFVAAIEQKSEAVAVEAKKEETQLQTTTDQVKQEIFSPTTNPTQEKLPEAVAQKVAGIKQEVPAAQVPPVTVQAPTPAPSAAAPSAPGL